MWVQTTRCADSERRPRWVAAPPDRGQAGEVADSSSGSDLRLDSRRGRAVLVATVAASAMGQLDATIVNVALPHIGADYGVDVSALQWVLTGYLVTLASLILLGGALGDRFGRRRVFLAGTIWFAVASLLCAAAPGVAVLIAARVLQGVGAALLTPGSLAILQASFTPDDRARTVGAWSALGGVAGAIGPFVGGWLVDGPGWRWAFLINLPVAAIVVVTSRSIPESRDEHAGPLDIGGAVIAVITLAATTLTLTMAEPRGWGDPLVLAVALVGVGGIVAFVRHIRRSPAPLVPPALFADRDFTVTNLATFTLYAAIGVSFFLVAYQLQVAAGWSALQAGTALLPATVLMLLLAARSGALAQRIGPRPQLTIGPLVLAGGLLLLGRVGTDPSWLRDVLPGAALFGIGLVTFVAPLTATVMGSVEPDHVSVASGVNNAVARTASLTALAVIPVVAGLTTATDPAEVTSAYRTAITIAAVCAALAAPLAFFGLSPRHRTRRSAREVYCPIDGPPHQPDPRRCAVPAAAGAGAAGDRALSGALRRGPRRRCPRPRTRRATAARDPSSGRGRTPAAPPSATATTPAVYAQLAPSRNDDFAAAMISCEYCGYAAAVSAALENDLVSSFSMVGVTNAASGEAVIDVVIAAA